MPDKVSGKTVYNFYENPFLCILDLRIYLTICGLILVYFIYRHVFKKSIYPLSEEDIGSFALCLQGILITKYIFLIFGFFLLNFQHLLF